jgi:hypothetical protein
MPTLLSAVKCSKAVIAAAGLGNSQVKVAAAVESSAKLPCSAYLV